jgi:hypothetical protein
MADGTPVSISPLTHLIGAPPSVAAGVPPPGGSSGSAPSVSSYVSAPSGSSVAAVGAPPSGGPSGDSDALTSRSTKRAVPEPEAIATEPLPEEEATGSEGTTRELLQEGALLDLEVKAVLSWFLQSRWLLLLVAVLSRLLQVQVLLVW